MNLVAAHFLVTVVSQKGLKERYQYLLDKLKKRTKKNEGKLYFGMNLFILLNGHFATNDLQEVINIIFENSRKCVEIANILAVDEITIPFEPSHEAKEKSKKIGWEIPHLYIERKPNSNCLWIDAICTKLNNSGLCYVLHIVPFYTQPQKRPIEVLQIFIDVLEKNNENFKFCLIMDARYDTKEVIEYFQEKNQYFVIGCHSGRHEGLEDILSEGLG